MECLLKNITPSLAIETLRKIDAVSMAKDLEEINDEIFTADVLKIIKYDFLQGDSTISPSNIINTITNKTHLLKLKYYLENNITTFFDNQIVKIIDKKILLLTAHNPYSLIKSYKNNQSGLDYHGLAKHLELIGNYQFTADILKILQKPSLLIDSFKNISFLTNLSEKTQKGTICLSKDAASLLDDRINKLK